jgi:DNA-binding transcriptional regulator YbjK
VVKTLIDDLRAKFRKQLYERYKHDLKEGILTADQAQQLLKRLKDALEKAKRSNRRVAIEGQTGTWSTEELEDQLSALRMTFSSYSG